MSTTISQTPDRLTQAIKLQYRDVKRFLAGLQWSLNHMAGSIRLYAELIKQAPGEREAEELERMLRQEKHHLILVEELYEELRGAKPAVQPAASSFKTYREGLQEAVRMEREAIRKYRDTYLLTPSPRVRDIYFLAMSDGVDQLAALFLLVQEASQPPAEWR